ncbi:hypothetical protein BK126_12970 [Paenibacillus sp. FSL H7-0326]|uniref:DUF2953 domain-containing protein n=1 Tax=Paenibacillus sp. FSL H7-0326 TaxID=1921144 RepID=UPI00096C4692|nr:DUF2953 domain-containing protein [Paenibacillus sp. FSL H7-0326]OMC68719.1 hypothetical protein BK126_12970 [Paenibacillus sp. FSL H7-0326]
MWIWIGAGILFVIILLIVLVLVSRIHIHLVVKSANNKQEVHVQLKMLYGILRITKEIPEQKIQELKAKLLNKLEVAMSDQLNGEDRQKDSVMPDEKHGKKGILHQSYALLKSAYALKIWDTAPFASIRILDLRWNSRIGTEDVVFTSIATGILWGIKNSILGWLSHKVRLLEMPQLDVTPNWTEQWDLKTDFEIRACIRFVKAMRLSNMLTKRLAEAHGGIMAWRRDLEEDA